MSFLAKRRLLVKSLWERGHREVAKLRRITGYPTKTLYRWAAQLTQTNDLKQGRRSGRPKKLSLARRKHLGRIAVKKKSATSKEIAETLNNTYPGLNIAPRTVRQNLQELGFKVCVPRKVPFLTKSAKQRRLTWARKYQKKRWNTTVFSDESTFQMFRNTVQVRYKAGQPVPTRGIVKHPFKVHVWGAFCEKGIVGFHSFVGTMDGNLYREILTQNLFEQANRILGDKWTFQQDNDPKHRAKLTTVLLQDHCPRVLDWPSYSPDLNPIENLWSVMKKRVEKRVNLMIYEKKSVSQEVFISIIEEEWEKIDAGLCRKLVRSMPKRLNLVIDNKGSETKY
jgi:transposase